MASKVVRSVVVKGKGKALDIVAATKYMGFAYSIYTRRLYLEGKVEGVRIRNGKREKVYLLVSSLDAYKAKARVRTSARRFLLHTDLENEAAVRTALKAAGIEFKLELAYKAPEAKA